VSFVCQSIGEVPPPSHPYRIVLLLQVFFKDTLYFLLKYVLPPVLFTLTQVVLLLITSTFTRVQIQSNLGTTEHRIIYLKRNKEFGIYCIYKTFVLYIIHIIFFQERQTSIVQADFDCVI
jgi:hypothetical protein